MEPSALPTPPARPDRRLLIVLLIAIPAVLLLLVAIVGIVLVRTLGPGGGETVVVRVGDADDGAAPTDEDIDRVVEVLGERVDGLDAGTPRITRPEDDDAAGDGALAGDDGTALVEVELPRLEDEGLDEALALLERPGNVSFHPVLAVDDRASATLTLPDDTGEPLQLGPERFDNAGVASAGIEYGTSWEIHIDFTNDGAASWQQLTGEAACHPDGDPRRRVAIVLDEEIISAPQLGPDTACDAGIPGRSTVIVGEFTREEADTLAGLVGTDPLPLPVELVSGPQNGAED